MMQETPIKQPTQEQINATRDILFGIKAGRLNMPHIESYDVEGLNIYKVKAVADYANTIKRGDILTVDPDAQFKDGDICICFWFAAKAEVDCCFCTLVEVETDWGGKTFEAYHDCIKLNPNDWTYKHKIVSLSREVNPPRRF